MEEGKTKRKFVMTPERLAKIMANLAQARLAPKEKVYRKTDKRYAANLRNLGMANSKRREEAQREEAALRAKMENAFPPEEVGGRQKAESSFASPESPVPSPGSSANPESPTPNPGSSANPESPVPSPGSSASPESRVPSPGSSAIPGKDELDQVTRLVGKRLRRVKNARRREGRRIMRVLTAALAMSHPLNLDQVASLATALLRCLDPGRITEEVRRLNHRIARSLLEMIEARYGPEPLSEWEARGLMLLERLRRLSAEEPGPGTGDSGLAEEPSVVSRPSSGAEQAPVDATVTGQGGVPSATDPGPVTTDASSADPQSQIPNPGSSASPESQIPSPAIPALPASEWEFRQLLTRALDLEPDDAQLLSTSIWDRLNVWEQRHQQESDEVEEFFQYAAANAPASDYWARYADREGLAVIVPSILELEVEFLLGLDSATLDVHAQLDMWQIKAAAATKSPPAKPPTKPSGDDESEESASGSGGGTAVA